MTISNSKLFSGVSALAFAVAGTAHADVTAEQVWQNWQDYTSTFGETLEAGSTSSAGGVLTLSDVTAKMADPDMEFVGLISEIQMEERDDGTVLITLSPEYDITIKSAIEGEDAIDMAIKVTQTGLSIVASGDPDSISYDYLAANLVFNVEDVSIDGESAPMTAVGEITDIDGKYLVEAGDPQKMISEMNAAAGKFDINFDDPDEGTLKLNWAVSDVSIASEGLIPEGIDFEDPTEIFNSSFVAGGKVTTGPGSLDMTFNDGTDSFSLMSTSESSSLNGALDAGTLSYGGTSTNVNYKIQSPQIPLPEVEFSVAEAAFDIGLPMRKSEEPEDFTMLFKMIGLQVNDMIWSMIDPTGGLPHDPADVIIDVDGQANWLVDITDPEQAESAMGEMPMELHALTVNEIKLALAGAEVNGTGDFTFDNTDLESFDGMPAPTGKLNLNLIGVNGLLDSLTSIGLLPQDQAMGARMMLGLFARPADGDDNMTSEIEVKGDGSVFANGQQLK